MLASKSKEDGPSFDTFSCLECKTVITTFAPARKDRGPNA